MKFEDSFTTLYNSDCRNMKELPDESVQCVVTSPPYWGLRKYSGLPDLVWGENHHGHVWTDNIQSGEIYDTKTGGHGSAKRTSGNVQTVNYNQPFCSLCGAWKGQFGLEPTVDLYVQHSIEILREVRRVLRKDGVVFWNLGDSYAGSGCGTNDYRTEASRSINHSDKMFTKTPPQQKAKQIGLKPKDLCLIPFRVALAAQSDGWWVRSVIIWSKNNPMPESVTDRPTESHEYILLLTKSAKYYWDQEAVREAYSPATFPRMLRGVGDHKYAEHPEMNGGGSGNQRRPNIRSEYESWQYTGQSTKDYESNGAQDPSDTKRRIIESIKKNETGRNLRSVWEFPTQPYKEAHFATFPEELPERCIKAGTPEVGCCSKCGAPWAREVEHKNMVIDRSSRDNGTRIATSGTMVSPAETITLGWRPSCDCNAEKVPSLVLDCFAGSGTTLWVAKKLGRKSVGYELSKEYCDLVVNRVRQSVMDLTK